jgi:hypothetical protein
MRKAGQVTAKYIRQQRRDAGVGQKHHSNAGLDKGNGGRNFRSLDFAQVMTKVRQREFHILGNF